jgi:hypothetical protein
MNEVRTRLDAMMVKLGYPHLTQKTNEDIIAGIEENLTAIDTSVPYELACEELKDIFYEKHWVSINTFISNEDLKTLYHILRDFKNIAGS